MTTAKWDSTALENKFTFWYTAGATRWPKNKQVHQPTKAPKVKAAKGWLSAAMGMLLNPDWIIIWECVWMKIDSLNMLGSWNKRTLSSHIIIRQPKMTTFNNEPIESKRQGGAFFGEIIFCMDPSRQILGLFGSTIIAKKSLARPTQFWPKVCLLPRYFMTPFLNHESNCLAIVVG